MAWYLCSMYLGLSTLFCLSHYLSVWNESLKITWHLTRFEVDFKFWVCFLFKNVPSCWNTLKINQWIEKNQIKLDDNYLSLLFKQQIAQMILLFACQQISRSPVQWLWASHLDDDLTRPDQLVRPHPEDQACGVSDDRRPRSVWVLYVYDLSQNRASLHPVTHRGNPIHNARYRGLIKQKHTQPQ